ncbi:hypothetical protein B0F90DRAFT_214982 [Multifurca ochricompacta]|uniref:Transmembrane protein n=1 Tax=Multifurca ochricompacta TaxID=376703 RepID=A0AAD4QN02_9AGAM|nr:hypothetical protein B0F90DRAFT_214982 [Multifurca ochricompacta]
MPPLRSNKAFFSSLGSFQRFVLALSPFVSITTAQSDELTHPHPTEEGCLVPPTCDAVIRYTLTLVRRARGRHISSQALTAIVLCSTVVFCALVGCILQLPSAFFSLRNRFRSGTPAETLPIRQNSSTKRWAAHRFTWLPICRLPRLTRAPLLTRVPGVTEDGSRVHNSFSLFMPRLRLLSAKNSL